MNGDVTANSGGHRLGVALSGGGHRATVWGWGTLLALADAGLNRQVVSIASVSGGSIANGVVANAGDYTTMAPGEVEDAIRDGMRVAAHDGLFFFGPATNGYLRRFLVSAGLAVGAVVSLVIALVGAGRRWPLPWWLLTGPVLAALVWAAALRRKPAAPPLLPGAMQAALLGAVVAGGSLAVAYLALTTSSGGAALAAAVAAVAAVTALLVWALLRVFGRRSAVVDEALGRTLLAREGRPALLAEVDRTVHHVFCATEIQSGDHVYLTPRLVYSYRAGRGTPGRLPLSTAVQSSACLPGAFVPRDLATGPFAMTRPWHVGGDEPPGVPPRLVVNDGGVYDNMADQWEQGYDGRAERLSGLVDLQPRADVLLVANASKAMSWSPLARGSRVAAEVQSLTRTVDILYDVSTSHRRQALVDRFRADGRLNGALVHIAQSPFNVPRAFSKVGDDDQRRRAREALDLLERLEADPQAWARRARADAGVKTTLAALTAPVAADLLEHAYLLTRVNAYVVLGLGDLPDDLAPFRRARFEALT
jgi:predicted acylesterase/phospholipase RssA